MTRRRLLDLGALLAFLALAAVMALGCSALCRSTTFYPADESILPGCEVP